MRRKNKHKNKPKNKGRKEAPKETQDETSRTPATVQNLEAQHTVDFQNSGNTQQPANIQQPADTQLPVDTQKPAETWKPAETQLPVDIQQPAEIQRSVKTFKIKFGDVALAITPPTGNNDGKPLETPFAVDDETMDACRKVTNAHIAATQQGLDPVEVRRAVERINTPPSKSQDTTGSDSQKTSGAPSKTAPNKDPMAFAEYIVEPDPVNNTASRDTLARSDEALESLEKVLRGAKDTNRKMQEIIQDIRATSGEIDRSIGLFAEDYGQRINELNRKLKELNATDLQENNTEDNNTEDNNNESNSDTGKGLEKIDTESNTPVETLRDATGRLWWQYGTATLPGIVKLPVKSKDGILNYKLFMCLIRRLKYSIPYDQVTREQAQKGTNKRKGLIIDFEIHKGISNQGSNGKGTSKTLGIDRKVHEGSSNQEGKDNVTDKRGLKVSRFREDFSDP